MISNFSSNKTTVVQKSKRQRRQRQRQRYNDINKCLDDEYCMMRCCWCMFCIFICSIFIFMIVVFGIGAFDHDKLAKLANNTTTTHSPTMH